MPGRVSLLLLVAGVLFASACGPVPAARAEDAPRVRAVQPAGTQRAEADREVERRRARRIAQTIREREAQRRFRTLSFVRAGIAVAGFAVFGWGVRQRRRRGEDRLSTARVSLLALLAVASFAAYYNFFGPTHPGGFKGADVFHYYMGSKYFEEVGYFELYHCTLAALVEDGRLDPAELPDVRDQRSLRMEPREATLRGMAPCRESFEPSRWRDFKSDVAFFRGRILGQSWVHLFEDHGYNPTPVWSFVGGLLSRTVAAGADTFPTLIQIDRALAVLMALLIAWAFGVEAACLAALVWGSSPLWSYNWIGDAFLRNAWLTFAVAGLCALERGRHATSGALLAASALLRLFPAAFIAAFLAHGVRRWRSRGPSSSAVRFVAGAGVAAAILLVAGAVGTGRGPAAYFEFGEKMSAVVGQPGVNKVGLSALASDLIYRATTREVTLSDGKTVRLPEPSLLLTGLVRGGQLALLAVGLFAFWRALSRVTAAESAVLGFALIPLLTSPANYYYPFVAFAAMLSARRPWTGVALCLAASAWIAASQIWFLEEIRFRVYDVIAVAFSLAVLLGVALSPPEAREPERALPTTA